MQKTVSAVGLVAVTPPAIPSRGPETLHVSPAGSSPRCRRCQHDPNGQHRHRIRWRHTKELRPKKAAGSVGGDDANVGNLTLARAFGRQRELALRLARGVSQRRLAALAVVLLSRAGLTP